MPKKRNKKPLCVVLDLDDTIADFCGELCWVHNKVNGTCVTKHDIRDWNFSTLRVRDARGNEVIGENLRKTFEYWEGHGLYASLNLIPKSAEAVSIMRKFGYKVILITARNIKYKDETKLNLWKHRVHYDEIYFREEEDGEDFKTKKIKQLAKTYNIQMFADDKFSTIEKAALSGVHINNLCLIETASTRDLETEEDNYTLISNEKIKKVRDLYDAARFLKDLTGGN